MLLFTPSLTHLLEPVKQAMVTPKFHHETGESVVALFCEREIA